MDQAEQEGIFSQWLSRYQALFFKFVRAYAFTPSDRDDLFQEITLQVWRSIPNFRGDAAETTWLYRISLNTAIAWSRKEKKHREGRQELEAVAWVLQETPADNPQLDWLYEQIAGLHKIDRALCLLMLDGFSYKEMAALLGISEGHVGVKLNRIKKRLIHSSQITQENGI